MKLAFVYAGQGAQSVGMGKDFYDHYVNYRETINRANRIMEEEEGFSLREISFEGPMERLSQTRYTQPCMTAFAIGITQLLAQDHIKPQMALGLSLGEYGALYAADVLDADSILRLVSYRGKVMEEAAAGREVKMVAILKAEDAQIEEAVKKAGAAMQGDLRVEIANYNCPGQTVISGDAQAVDKACDLLKEAGVKRMVPLTVSGPFHTSLMAPAGEVLYQKLAEFELCKPEIPVIANETAQPISIAQMKESLKMQVQSSVRLSQSLQYLETSGITHVIEIGPGATISKFIAKAAPSIKTHAISTVEDYLGVQAFLDQEA
ncbi:MAG: ACP S-malonyltransferase [Lachnospiraceae bacterium]|nr:ACP S-malonyltransferase [Lachnospiraceae bacterium]